MEQDYYKRFRFNESGVGCWLTLLLGAFLLGALGLGWVVNGFLVLLLVLLVTPIVGWWAFRWWFQRNLVEDRCPVCSYEFTGFNGTQCRCPNCGESLKVEAKQFVRLTPPGTIEVDAVEVPAKSIED